jgi:hypothetical protein
MAEDSFNCERNDVGRAVSQVGEFRIPLKVPINADNRP